MRTFTFNHQMRGRADRCEVCGGPLLLGVSRRCIPCRVFPEYRTRRSLGEEEQTGQTAVTDPGLPPGFMDDARYRNDPNYPTLRSERDQRAIERRARLEALEAQAREAEELLVSMREREEEAVWARVEGDKPAFPLDSRCAICCLIMTEYAHPPYVMTASEPGYRCPAHAGARIRRDGHETTPGEVA